MQTFSAEHDLPADWWTLFHSQVLDELIRRALADNPTVQAAKATLQTAMATYKAQGGALLLPAADAQVSATAEYRQAVLLALQDVADTLRALEADARTLQADIVTENDAQDTLNMTRLL